MTPSNGNTSGLAPVRWLVTVIATGAQDVHEKPLFDTEFNHKRFTCEPLVTAASAQARIAELEQWQAAAIRSARIHDENIREFDARATAAEARADRLASALTDLVSWFDKPVQGERGMVWVIRAGDQGADDAVTESRAALQQEPTT